MNSVVYVPFAASVLVAVLSRLGAHRLWPRAAVWAITVSSAALSLSTVGALIVLASPLPAQAPPVAKLGRWQPGAVATHTPVPWIVSTLALVALIVLARRLIRAAGALVGEARAAAAVVRAANSTPRGGYILLIEDPTPHAHAVGVGVTGRGTIVLSSSMLRLLDDDERAAVVAHERTHLVARHTVFSTVVRLAVAMNPLLVPVSEDLRFALERAADEAAAVDTDRAVVASALAKVALALLAKSPQVGIGFAFHRNDLTHRVAAMLDAPNRRSRPAWLLIAVASAAAVALVWATHDTERFFEAVRLWSRR